MIDAANAQPSTSFYPEPKRSHARDAYGGGTGVGLTIAKKIVERHGGTVWVESEPQLGSTFYMALPR